MRDSIFSNMCSKNSRQVVNTASKKFSSVGMTCDGNIPKCRPTGMPCDAGIRILRVGIAAEKSSNPHKQAADCHTSSICINKETGDR